MLPLSYTFLVLTVIHVDGIPLNLPERNPYGSLHLTATLTNEKTGVATYLEEYLSTLNDNERGKILVQRKDQSPYTIFYNENDNFRLVMDETNCQVCNYNNRTWNKRLPGVNNELENILIMFGPTIYYRIQAMLIETSYGEASLTWMKGYPKEIRGRKVETAWTIIEKTLNVTVYKQDIHTGDSSFSLPFRIEFNGFIPETFPMDNQILVIDFHIVETVKEGTTYEVSPTPGIGCLEYLERPKSFPNGITTIDNFYFTAKEINSEGDEISLKMFVDSTTKIVRYLINYGKSLMETIYDYNLGISYSFISSQCTKSSMVSGDVGVVDGKFNVKELLWQHGNFLYLGKILYKHRSGVPCDVWEKSEYNVNFEGSIYSKIVTTHYFIEKSDLSSSDSLVTPIGMVKTFYNLDQKNYRFIKTMRRDIYEFSDSIPDYEYKKLFQVYDCSSKVKDKLWLTFVIKPVDVLRPVEAIKTAEKNLLVLSKGIRDYIVETISISPLRIANIEFNFDKDLIYARVWFIERPALTDGLVRFTRKVNKGSLSKISGLFGSLSDCIRKAAYKSYVRSIMWCKDSDQQLCAFMDPGDIKPLNSSGSDTISCEIYTHSVGDLRDLVDELPLSNLHDTLLNRNTKSHLMIGQGSYNEYKFQVNDIIYSDPTGEEFKKSQLIYSKLFIDFKLRSGHPSVYNTADQIILNFADCYHLCSSSNSIDCSGFSFCVNPVNESIVSCLLTNQILTLSDDTKTRETIEADSSCDTYGKNHILDYVKITDRQIVSTSVGQLTVSPNECASLCAQSDDCKSFDYCDNSVCTLSENIYLDRLSKPNSDCNSYMLKRSENFKITGNNLVEGIMFVETGINLDQCSSLCFDYTSEGKRCLSFNYCPKGKSQSTCQLSRFKLSTGGRGVSKGEKQSSTPLIDTSCFNYELIDSSTMFADQLKDEKTINSAGGGVLAIVLIVCLFAGFIFGFVGEYIYLNVKKSNKNPSTINNPNNDSVTNRPATFSWSRQIDDDESAAGENN